MTTQELLNTYYRALAAKTGWDAVLAEDFRFTGGDMTHRTPTVGREAYVRIVAGLGRLFSALTVGKPFVEGDQAFVLVDYDWTLPGGNVRGPVAELWKVEGGKLAELTIFFDTKSFDRLAKG